VAACVAVALVSALLAAGPISQAMGSSPATSPAAGSGFSITSSIYRTPGCAGAPAQLYPGTPDCFVFTVTNDLGVPITVTSLSVSISDTLPAKCPASDFVLPMFRGYLPVPARGSAEAPGLRIEMLDLGNQDACEGLTLHFAYTGSAHSR
jgi:hypothetical protein